MPIGNGSPPPGTLEAWLLALLAKSALLVAYLARGQDEALVVGCVVVAGVCAGALAALIRSYLW